MKNIAIPLLLAGSAKAEAKKKAAMLFDYAMPEPILIASSWTGDVCVDAASDVSAALSALQTAQDAVTESSEGVAALELTQTEALEARVEAVAAVTELADAMETAVNNNNDAIDTWFLRKGDWQAAAVVASVGQANKITLEAATASALGLLDAAKVEYYGADTAGGLLADTATALQNKVDAETTRDADNTTTGSLLYRDAKSTALGYSNCSSIATGIVSTLGLDDYQLVCPSGSSLAELDTAQQATLITRDTASLAQARTYLLEREFYAIDKTIGWAKAAAENNSNFSVGTVAVATLFDAPSTSALRQDKPRTTASPGIYTAGTWYSAMDKASFTQTAALTQSQALIFAGMEALEADPTATVGAAATATASATWLAKLQLVYGSLGASTGPVQYDGDSSGGTNSQEYLLEQTGATGAEDFIVVARAQVEALRALVAATFTNTPTATDVSSTSTNTQEIDQAAASCTDAGTVDAICTAAVADENTCVAASSGATANTCVWAGDGDAYAGAYTLVTTGNAGVNNGAMAVVTGTNLGSAITWGSAGTGNPISTNSLIYVLGFGFGLTAADVGGGTDLNASSMCAAACTALAPWNMDAATNFPILQATTAMSTTECTGFQVTVTGSAGDPDCKLIYGGIPTTTAADGTNNLLIGTYSRNWSVLAQTYLTAAAAANIAVDGTTTADGTGSTAIDYFMLSMTTWNTAYEDLIDARAALNLAIQYTVDITLTYDNTASGLEGTQQLYEIADVSGAKFDYDLDVITYNLAKDAYDADVVLYNARVITIATDRSDYALAQAQWESNNALISKMTVLHEIATAASGASLIAEQALDGIWVDAASDSATAADDYLGVADALTAVFAGGQVQALATALENMTTAEEAVTGVAGTESLLGVYAASPAGSGDLGDLFTLRATALTAYTDLTDAMDALSTLNDTIEGKQRDVEDRLADHLSAIVACKVENYDNYTQTLQLAIGAREDDLEDILALVTQAEADAPAAGEAGWRCEKALSNGTFRPTRGETTCNENLCCGAASVPVGEAVMTIETCQSSDTTTYSYVPPRGPMETTAPAADTFPFVCIEGAQKLAAAASALATAVYMLA